MKKRVLIYFFLLIFSAQGCMSLTIWSEMSRPDYRDRGRGFSALVPAGWMRYNLYDYFVITRDGLALETIEVKRQPLGKKLEETKKEFTAEMTPQDIAELEIDNLQTDKKIGQFKVLSNKPATIDGHAGFVIDYEYRTESGLKMHGIHYGFLKDKWVYRIRYTGARQYYFEHCQEDFKKFIESFKVI